MNTTESAGRRPSERARAKSAQTALTDLADKYRELKAQLDAIGEQLAEIRDERTEKSDSRSDEWQESDKGQEFTAATDALDNVCATLEGLFDTDELDAEIDNLGTFIDDAYSSGKRGDA